jgi:RsiW-degrading membrane proteinase PrsW (M82 family)
MKILLIVGIVLLFYAMFLTPAYFEPLDAVISTTYIASWNAMGLPLWLLILWIISGYVALVIAILLHVHFAFRIKHPVIVGIIITIFAVIIGYYFIVVNKLITFG